MDFEGAIDPEMLAQIRAQQDRQVMARQEYVLTVNRLIDSLDAEQAYALRRLMIDIGLGSQAQAFQIIGQLDIILRRIHGVCSECGTKDHVNAEHETMSMADEAARELLLDPPDREGDNGGTD